MLIIPSRKSELKQAQRTTTPNPNYEEKILNFLICLLFKQKNKSLEKPTNQPKQNNNTHRGSQYHIERQHYLHQHAKIKHINNNQERERRNTKQKLTPPKHG